MRKSVLLLTVFAFLIIFMRINSFSYSPFPQQQEQRKSLARTLFEMIELEDVDAAKKLYSKLKKEKRDSYNFDWSELNLLGYYLIHNERKKEGLEIFKLNAEVYPDWRSFDSLADGYMYNWDLETAKKYYKKSFELNPENSITDAMNRIYLMENYEKHEFKIPMRDGVKLFTQVYTPKDKITEYPILIKRTPYSINPYSEEDFPWWIGILKNLSIYTVQRIMIFRRRLTGFIARSTILRI